MADQAPGEPRPGFVASVRRLLRTLVAIVHNRVELVAAEFQEELARLTALLIYALAGLLALAIGLALVAVTLLLAIAPQYRVLASAILALLFLAAAGGAWLGVRRIVRAKPWAFDATPTELEKDHTQLGDAS